MAKVVPIGQPANDAERQAISFLRDRLPSEWIIFHNFEMRQGKDVFEIDLAVLAPHALYLIDVKGTQGSIDVYGSKWYPDGRQPFHSPMAKLRNHAKIMATLIADLNPGMTELRKVHVQALVLLTSDDAQLNDLLEIDSPDVINYKHFLKYINDKSKIPGQRLTDIRKYHSMISKAIQGKAKPRSVVPVYGNWQVDEKLGGTDRYVEYRARHTLLGKSGGMTRLRVYTTDPYKSEAERETEFRFISNAYKAVAQMPPHPNVLAVRDLIVAEDKTNLVLVTDDVAGQILRQHLLKPSLALTFDQKLQVMNDVLHALDHAHRYEVIHRNLTPDAILVKKSGEAIITAFDFARVGKNRTSTIADDIIDDINPDYQAPECYRDPSEASIASDLFATGLIFYELLTGKVPYENIDQMMELDGQFPIKPSLHKQDIPIEIDNWLQKFCEFDPEERHTSSAIARKWLSDVILPEGRNDPRTNETQVDQSPVEFTNLPHDYVLANRFRIQKRLGVGGFGVAYKVFDSMGDVVRVIKLVIKDRLSVYERLKREYKTLTNIPDHPHVVKVIWADRLSDESQTPYIVFEYVDGLDVSDLIEAEALSLEDGIQIAREVAEGLSHLHKHGVYHQDIKPSNILWTDNGVRIIDFNVAVSENDDNLAGGGTRRYLPPDYDLSSEPSSADRIDRDLYAFGITLYECITGCYPFNEFYPPQKKQPKDPKQLKGCGDLSSSLVSLMVKMIAPEQKDRFETAEDFMNALNGIKHVRSFHTSMDFGSSIRNGDKSSFESKLANYNPFVSHLLTLYSQSQVSNAGTRGLDEIGRATYVATSLDEKLKPELLKGEHHLVIITGNAGDGKTAFIQQFEDYAVGKGVQMQRGSNGTVFQLNGHSFYSNYDGSQDEGDEHNEVVLNKFFSSFKGTDRLNWPSNQTRLIAINEGRLVDFFRENESEFQHLSKLVHQGLSGGTPVDQVVIINLNLRSIVAEKEKDQLSILERLIERMTLPKYWNACESCDIRNKCYAIHNAKTLQDSTAGSKIIERLKMLYTITHLRGRLHITMRDLRSALAYMLVGTRNCNEIHQLYQKGGDENQNKILDSYYFNSWLGGNKETSDRLISLLREIDVALVSNPDLDRSLIFVSPEIKKMSRYSFSERSSYDDDLMKMLFNNLPRDYSIKSRKRLIEKHQNYITHMRRRHYFERRDDGWKDMLPYRSIDVFLKTIQLSAGNTDEELSIVLKSINRGEGLNNSNLLGNQLALRVRKVEHGTIKSYRLFKGEKFSLLAEQNSSHPFLEVLPHSLILQFNSEDGHRASLRITLDIFEMLMKINDGYRPSIEEEKGIYLSLAVFKNVLSAAPYQEVLITESGLDFFKIRREFDGVLHLENLSKEVNV